MVSEIHPTFSVPTTILTCHPIVSQPCPDLVVVLICTDLASPLVRVDINWPGIICCKDGGGDHTEEFATHRIDTGVPGHDNQPVF